MDEVTRVYESLGVVPSKEDVQALIDEVILLLILITMIIRGGWHELSHEVKLYKTVDRGLGDVRLYNTINLAQKRNN